MTSRKSRIFEQLSTLESRRADPTKKDRTSPPDRDDTIRALCDDLGAISGGLVFITEMLRDRREDDTTVIRECSELLSHIGNGIEKIRAKFMKMVE